MPTSSKALRHLAVIPARGGSKRLPRKNIIEFFGKPIIAYTIAAAKAAAIFDRVLVSTEDEAIARVARKWDGDVDARPPSLAADHATVVDVCIELLDRLEREGEIYDTLTVLYATAPLRTTADILATLALLQPGECHFAMGAVEFDQPVHQAMREDPEGRVLPVFPELVSRRSDAVGRYLAGNGSTYCVLVDAFRRERTFYGRPLSLHVMPRERSVDIDTADDLALAAFYDDRLGLRRKTTKAVPKRRTKKRRTRKAAAER
jgi:pseudaminic acid cytidylyltransferase